MHAIQFGNIRRSRTAGIFSRLFLPDCRNFSSFNVVEDEKVYEEGVIFLMGQFPSNVTEQCASA